MVLISVNCLGVEYFCNDFGRVNAHTMLQTKLRKHLFSLFFIPSTSLHFAKNLQKLFLFQPLPPPKGAVQSIYFANGEFYYFNGGWKLTFMLRSYTVVDSKARENLAGLKILFELTLMLYSWIRTKFLNQINLINFLPYILNTLARSLYTGTNYILGNLIPESSCYTKICREANSWENLLLV